MKSTFLAAFCVIAATAAYGADQCPPLQRVAALDLELPKRGPALVPVSIGGETMRFVLGTASAQSAISAAAAERLKLTTRASSLAIINTRGNTSNTVAIARDVRLGGIHYDSMQLRVRIEDPSPAAPQGMIGADLMRNYDIDLDFGNRKMNVIKPEHCADSVVYWPTRRLARLPMRVNDDNYIVFKVMLDGHEIEATIDTAMARTVLTKPMAAEAFGIDENSPGVTQIGGERLLRRFSSLSVEGLEVKNPNIVIVPDATAHMRTRGNGKMSAARGLHQPPPLRLGMSTLRQLHVYIDYKNLTIYFTPAQADALGATEPAEE